VIFIDKVKMYIKAGNGGNGSVSFRREKYVPNGGPDGGDGGRGGNVIFVVDEGKNTLLDYKNRRKHVAQNGENGGGKRFAGKSGTDLFLPVPKGTVIKDAETGKVIHDMSDGEPYIAARGGKGGWGNSHFATPTRQAPRFAKNGTEGEERDIILELKMIADVGLVGFPNVGKSTLLSKITAANPKIGNYPFTTLTPNLGVASVYEQTFVVADIPGLIEGASEGLGLGHDFLRHIDRCRLMLHLFDASCEEGEMALEKIKKIINELEKFSPALASRPMILVGNKQDSVYDESLLEGVEDFAKEKNMQLYYISAVTGKGLKELLEGVAETLKTLPPIIAYESEISFDITPERVRETVIENVNGVYHVTGEWIKRAAGGVYFDDYESFNYFQKILKKGGVFEALVERGIKEGDTVEIYGLEFNYVE